MPYPNEHAARIHEPSKYVRMRRENNKFGDGIHVIWGVPKSGATEVQAIRFDSDKFTPEEAKKWCKDHDYKVILFEAATGGEEKKSQGAAPPEGASWFSIVAKAEDEPVEVFIYDEIGRWGIDAQSFIQALRAHKGKAINLRINSPGGGVFDGAAIYNALRSHGGRIESHVEGLAASMASVIALAGDTVEMAKNAFFMIHNPWVIAIGDSAILRKRAELLDKIRDTMLGTYSAKSGRDFETIRHWMDEETWFGADAAKEAGFCDVVGDEMKVAACFDLAAFGYHPPAALAAAAGDGGEASNAGTPPAEPAAPPAPPAEPAPETPAPPTDEEKRDREMRERWMRLGPLKPEKTHKE